MVLNYRPANYIGWPIPAFLYATKVQLFSELCKFLSNYFVKIAQKFSLLHYLSFLFFFLWILLDFTKSKEII